MGHSPHTQAVAKFCRRTMCLRLGCNRAASTIIQAVKEPDWGIESAKDLLSRLFHTSRTSASAILEADTLAGERVKDAQRRSSLLTLRL
jgi:hypothetical protein